MGKKQRRRASDQRQRRARREQRTVRRALERDRQLEREYRLLAGLPVRDEPAEPTHEERVEATDSRRVSWSNNVTWRTVPKKRSRWGSPSGRMTKNARIARSIDTERARLYALRQPRLVKG